MINHRSNCRIEKIGCYHIPLYRPSSRAGDKRTRTADIRHRNPATGEPGTESFTPLSARLFGLKNAVLRMSDCSSPTLTAQPKSGQLMRSTY
ncbi:hypothetical protein ACHQM5_031067 [Ranunculus cassubicifolius]